MIDKMIDKSKRILRTKGKNNLNNNCSVKDETIQKKLHKFDIFLLLIIFACGFHLFSLTDWAWKHGVFNISDVGLFIIVISFIFLLLKGLINKIIINSFSILIMFFIFIVLIQVVLAAFFYGQSILDGLIAIRHQFYYLSFFVFFGLLDNKKKIYQALNVVTVLAILLSVMGLINYFITPIYHHQWAEGHGERSGVLRAYVAGIDIISLGLFWSILQWVYDKKSRFSHAASAILFLLMIIIVQTRGRIVGIFGSIIFLLVYKKNYKIMAQMVLFILIIVLFTGIFSKENILIDSFVSTYDEISEGMSGGNHSTWTARLEQLNMEYKVFIKHPLIGSGVSALRVGNDSGLSNKEFLYLGSISRNEDMGYTNWIKSYGLAGLVWLMLFYYFLIIYMKKSANLNKGNKLEPVVFTVSGYIIFVIISFITLPHFMRTDLILLLCFVLAILVRTYQFGLEMNKEVQV